MKKIFIAVAICFLSIQASAQQFLWTTDTSTTMKSIPMSSALTEVMKYYDFYDYYYDGTGYNKAGFIQMFEKSQSFNNINVTTWRNFKSKLLKISKPTITAFKSNDGKGSAVMVICVTKDNVDIVTFSSNAETESRFTGTSNRSKFIAWFKQLLGLEMMSNHESETIDMDLRSNSETDDVDAIVPTFEVENSNDIISNNPQIKANFPGGEGAFRSYVAGEFVVPPQCSEKGLSCSLNLRFIVDEAGRISNVKVKSSSLSCPECQSEAIRVMMKSPRWVPAKNNGTFLKSYREIPINIGVN